MAVSSRLPHVKDADRSLSRETHRARTLLTILKPSTFVAQIRPEQNWWFDYAGYKHGWTKHRRLFPATTHRFPSRVERAVSLKMPDRERTNVLFHLLYT